MAVVNRVDNTGPRVYAGAVRRLLVVAVLCLLPTLLLGQSSINNPPSGGSGSSAFNAITGGTNTSAAMIVGSGSSLISTGTGQIIGDSDWYNLANGISYPFQPTYTASNTGGSLTQGIYYFRLTYVGLGTTIPSAETRFALNAANCVSNSTCQITVNMPTACTAGNLPAGATGCTVWDDATVVNAEKQQAASNACVNITTATCVVNVLAAGSALTFPASSGQVPSPLTAITQPDGLIPTTYMQIGDGSYIPVAGVDYSAINASTPFATTGQNCPAIGCMSGRFTWTAPFFFNDTNAAPIQANNQVSIHHLAGQNTGANTSPGIGVDDRAFGVEMVDAGATNVNYEQSLSQYNERIISNNNITCNPISAGNPVGESCFAAGRFVASDTRTANAGTTYITAVAGVTSAVGATAVAGGFQAAYIGGTFGAAQSTTGQNGQSNAWVGVYAQVSAATSNTSSSGYTYFSTPPVIRFATQNVGYYTKDFGSNAADWNVLSLSTTPGTTGNNMFQGTVYFPGYVATNGTFSAVGSMSLTGGLATTQVSAPTIFSLAPVNSGAQTCAYKATAVDVNGNESTASAQLSTGVCNANITATNNVVVTISSQKGVSSYNIYRTVEAGNCNGIACTNGKIGNVVVAAMTTIQANGTIFTDTGFVGDGNTAVAQQNTTGGLKLAGSLIDASTAAPVPTGTGACATSSTQKGGSVAGQITCTGTTGASTLVLTQTTVAPNGWACYSSDLTTANALRQSTTSTTACTIAGTVNQNDVLTFIAVAY